MRLYDAWKNQSDKFESKTSKALKHEYDYATKDYLIKFSGKRGEYATQSNYFHGKKLTVGPDDRLLDQAIHDQMHKPNFNHCSNSASKEHLTTFNKLEFAKNAKIKGSPANRRCDPNNPNRVINLKLGDKQYPNEPSNVDLSKAEFINNDTKQKRLMDLTNKFEYGLDQSGGIAAREGPVKNEDIQKCLDHSKQNYAQSIANKELIEKQNFTIKPEIPLQNSETKYIGQQVYTSVTPRLDYSALKQSNVPIRTEESSLYSYSNNASVRRRQQISFNQEFDQLQRVHKTTRVPFAQG